MPTNEHSRRSPCSGKGVQGFLVLGKRMQGGPGGRKWAFNWVPVPGMQVQGSSLPRIGALMGPGAKKIEVQGSAADQKGGGPRGRKLTFEGVPVPRNGGSVISSVWE